MTAAPSPEPTGRLAPSPTGVLHIGNARSLLLAWLSVRSRGGRVLLRIEDLVPGPPEGISSLLSDLCYLGLDWDPPSPGAGVREVADFFDAAGEQAPFVLQSERHAIYQRVLARLSEAGLVYPCVCTRREIEQAVRAPHAEDRGRAYPGTCRDRFAGVGEALEFEAMAAKRAGRATAGVAMRLKVPTEPMVFEDALCGTVRVCLPRESGDFVIRRKDSAYAYMLAVVVDDLAMGVDEVVRGDDLLDCTGQQLALFDAIVRHGIASDLGAPVQPAPPRWLHVPLVYGDDGRRLAKRDRSLHVQTLQQMGVPGAQVRRWLAGSLGLPDSDDPAEMAAHFSWPRLPRDGVVFGAQALATLVGPQGEASQ